MPFAVLGMYATTARNDMLGALDFYNLAIEKDATNTSAWLWKGILLKEVGYMDGAILSFEQCLANDPGYQNCRQHMAVAYLNNGDVAKAVALNGETLEHIFHSISHAFVSTYVRSGHRILAAHIADAKLGHDNAPVMEWIRAIENPEADNSAGLVQLQDWARRTTTGVTLHWVPHIFLAFSAYDELTSDPEGVRWVLWHPDAEEFRSTPQFKQIIRELGAFAFWQVHGFPSQCRAIGDDDFDCSGPG
jgi:tetratricopeptide (TPR) repeat protein